MTSEVSPKLSQELDHYDGRWVAMRRGLVIAHAEDEETLRAHPHVREGDHVFPIGDPVTGFYMLGV